MYIYTYIYRKVLSDECLGSKLSNRIDVSSLILSLIYTQLCYHSIEHFMPR